MSVIFYEEAASLLGVSVDTLAHAVSRGELTKAGIQGNRRLLIKEQVMLFTGINPRTRNKKRISKNALSEQEQASWKRYASEAGKQEIQISSTVEQLIDEKIREELARREAERIVEEEKALELKKERFHKEYPFHRTRQITEMELITA